MPTFKITLLNEDKSQFEDIHLPAKFEVCPRCQGGGKQDVYDGGMTGDEMAEAGQEFAEDYAAGVYFKPCEECNGKRVVAVADRSLLNAKQAEQLDEHERLEVEYFRSMINNY